MRFVLMFPRAGIAGTKKQKIPFLSWWSWLADEADTKMYQLYQLNQLYQLYRRKERDMETAGVMFCFALMALGVIGAVMQKAKGNW